MVWIFVPSLRLDLKKVLSRKWDWHPFRTASPILGNEMGPSDLPIAFLLDTQGIIAI